MSEDYIQVPPDSTGKRLRTLKRTVEGREVHEEAFVLVNPFTGELIDPRDVKVNREGSITHFNVTLTGAGSSVIYTPSTGKKAKVIGFFAICTEDVYWEIRFSTSHNFIGGLPIQGAVGFNGVGMEMPTGDTDETIEVYADGACTIKGWISIKEI